MTQLPTTDSWLQAYPLALDAESQHLEKVLDDLGSRPPDMAHPTLGMYGEVHPWYEKRRRMIEEIISRTEDPEKLKRRQLDLRLHQIDTAEAYARLKPFRRAFQLSGMTPEEYQNKVTYDSVRRSWTGFGFDYTPIRVARGAGLWGAKTIGGFFPSVEDYFQTRQLYEEHQKAATVAQKKGLLGERPTRIMENAAESIAEFSALLGTGMGLYGAIGMQSVSQVQDTMYAAEAAGVGARTAAIAGVASGLIEAGVTTAMQVAGHGGMEEALDKLFGGIGARPGIRGILINMASEVGEEATIYAAQSLVEKVSKIDPSALESEQFINGLIDTMATAALAAGSSSGTAEVVSRAQETMQHYGPAAMQRVREATAKVAVTPKPEAAPEPAAAAVQKPGPQPTPEPAAAEAAPEMRTPAYQEGQAWAEANPAKAEAMSQIEDVPSRSQFESATGQTKTTKQYRADYQEGVKSTTQVAPEPVSQPAQVPEYNMEREQNADRGQQLDWAEPFSRKEDYDVNIDQMNFDAIRPIPTPELKILAEELGFAVKKANLRGGVLGKMDPKHREILLSPKSARDHRLLAKVIAHEIGHLIDYLPEETFKRGNLLGRIASLQGYRKSFLSRLPGANPFPAAELERLRRLAEKENTIDFLEEVEEQIKIRTDVTPQDILNIWNSLDESIINQKLRDYIKRLSDGQKHSIVLEAFKGTIPQDLQRFAQERTEIVKKQVWTKKLRPKKYIEKTYQDLLMKEIEARQIFNEQRIRTELNNLSQWWTPYDPAKSSPHYIAYRRSGVELYADALSVLLNSPGEVSARAPTFWKSWLNYLENKPEVARTFIELQEILNGTSKDYALREADRYHSMYDRGTDAFLAYFEAKRRSRQGIMSALLENYFVFSPKENIRAAVEKIRQLRTSAMNGFVHRGWGLLHMQEKARKRGAQISDKVNAQFWLEQLFRPHGSSEAWKQDFNEYVWRPLHEFGINENDFGMYLDMRRVINERWRFLNPMAETPESAEQGIDRLRERLGEEKFRRMAELAQKFYDLEFQVAQFAKDNGMYSQKQWDEIILPNSDAYVTNLPIKYVTDTLPFGIKKIVGSVDEKVHPVQSTVLKMLGTQLASEINRLKRLAIANLETIDPGSTMWKKLDKDEKVADSKGELRVRVDGKIERYEVPWEYATVFSSKTGSQEGNALKRAINTVNYGCFYKLYITYNPAFAIRNPSRDIQKSYVTVGAFMAKRRRKTAREMAKAQGIPYTEALKKVAGPPTYAEFIRAVGEAIPAARAQIVDGEYDPLINKLLATGALDVPFSKEARHRDIGISDEAAAQAIKDMGIFPEPQQLENTRKRFQQAWNAIEKHLPQIIREHTDKLTYLNPATLIDIEERAAKLAGYKVLEPLMLTDAEMAFAMNNFVGTPNTRYRGLWSDVENLGFMFFSIRMANLRAQALAARMSPMEYTKRIGITIASTRTLRRLAKLGAAGGLMQQFFELIGDDEDEFVIPLPMVVTDPEDKKEKALYFRIPQDETVKFWGNLHDLVWDGIENLAKNGDVDAAKAMKETMQEAQNMTVGTLAPPWDIVRVWRDYALDRIPMDDYFNTPLFSQSMKDARGENYNALRKMMAWTWMKFGALEKFASPIIHSKIPVVGVGEVFEPRPSETSLERRIRSIPGLDAIFRISDRGATNAMWTAKREKDAKTAHLSSLLGADPVVNQVVQEFNMLHSFKTEELEEKDQNRKAQLEFWGKMWFKVRDEVASLKELGQTEEMDRLIRTFSADTAILREIWAAEDRGDEKAVRDLQKLFATRAQ